MAVPPLVSLRAAGSPAMRPSARPRRPLALDCWRTCTQACRAWLQDHASRFLSQLASPMQAVALHGERGQLSGQALHGRPTGGRGARCRTQLQCPATQRERPQAVLTPVDTLDIN